MPPPHFDTPDWLRLRSGGVRALVVAAIAAKANGGEGGAFAKVTNSWDRLEELVRHKKGGVLRQGGGSRDCCGGDDEEEGARS